MDAVEPTLPCGGLPGVVGDTAFILTASNSPPNFVENYQQYCDKVQGGASLFKKETSRVGVQRDAVTWRQGGVRWEVYPGCIPPPPVNANEVQWIVVPLLKRCLGGAQGLL